MKGDFSRNTFDRRNHYIGVRWQQGRPTTDADENEAQDILVDRVESEAQDVIGQSGAPKENPGFGLSVDTTGELVIGAGHFYVDGILCLNDTDVTYAAQPGFPDPPAIPGLMGGASIGLVYIDVLKRHLTFQDRERMRDEALNGVDTTTRVETVWQTKVLPLPSVAVPALALTTLTDLAKQIATLSAEIAATADPAARQALISQRDKLHRQLRDVGESLGVRCDGDYAEWNALTAPLTGTLQVTTVPGTAADDPCDVPVAGGYTRGENQFYTVQVHTVPAGGGRNGATFKWSRDNGSVVSRIEAAGSATSGSVAGTVFDVDSVQRDDYLGIHNDDWVEYLDDTHELNGLTGVLARVTNADVNLNRLTLDRSVTVNFERHPKLRKWDQSGTTAVDSGVAMNTTNVPQSLENGIQVEFGDGTYRPGDYWQFAARAVSGTIDFPAGPQPAFGVQHHYARLGIVSFSSGQLDLLLDCRDLFPPLTAITASDVGYDNSTCNIPDARTVQEAIDYLCGKTGSGGTCTLTAAPAPDWFEVFSQVAKGKDAEICLGVGDFEVKDVIVVADKGHLKIKGAGPGTRIRAQRLETAIIFQGCASVTISDLQVVTGATASAGAKTEGLQGTLTFENCVSVSLERVVLRCASGTIRSASCLRVMNRGEFANIRDVRGIVSVQDCRFEVGSNQVGGLIINGARVHFENNLIQCIDTRKESQKIPAGLEKNSELRAELRRVIFSHMQEGNATGNERETLTLNDVTVNVRSDPRLREFDFFSQLVNIFSASQVRDVPSAEQYLQEAVDAVLMKPDTIPSFVPYFDRLRREDEAALYQGITVAGEEAEEVRILNNTIISALQGVHLGQSRRNQPEGQILKSTIVAISGNTIYSRITPVVNREAYGIYVGHCESLYVENNVLRRDDLESTQHMAMDGIHNVGELGKRLIVRHNETTPNYRFGVYVDPQNDVPGHLWMVVDNVASVPNSLTADARVQVGNNIQ